ncbi:putative pentatricopeptide [Rosa chinensis]|uniref:Putative pentatricopeptide n=1 Tax=Rosa chinensis TaxID=74649 RepID=A0A2P6QEL4_ROSCH|nr:putative pentatricopeptide [Rosa chinensis]
MSSATTQVHVVPFLGRRYRPTGSDPLKDFAKLCFGLKHNVRISNSLIDMYSRCGCIDFARQVFDNMPDRTLVSWNSMIVGFAANGHAEEALVFFNLMQKEGFKPDGVSFTGALTACSHAGLVDEGLRFFDNMKRIHKITPRIEHYGWHS